MNKPIYFCIGIVSFLFICFAFFIKNANLSETLLSAYIGIGGALIGATLCGIVSGYYSYYGGMKVTEKNYELLRSLASEEKKNTMGEHSRQLFAQLKFSYDLIMNNDNLIPIKELIYDPEWYKHLAIIDSLNQQKKELITRWFHEIIMLKNLLEIADHNQEADSTQRMIKMLYIGGNGIMQASLVRKKLNKILPEIKKILDDNY